MADHARRNELPGGPHSPQDPTPKRRVLLFEFTRNEHLYHCELLDHVELGIEARFTKNGEFLEGRLCESLKVAALWADERRKAIEKGVD